MKPILKRSKLQVKPSPIHGYGVFAESDFQPQDVIEECYALPVTEKNPGFNDYNFLCGSHRVFPLGFGVIYNHSEQFNAACTYYADTQIFVVHAVRLIQRGKKYF